MYYVKSILDRGPQGFTLSIHTILSTLSSTPYLIT